MLFAGISICYMVEVVVPGLHTSSLFIPVIMLSFNCVSYAFFLCFASSSSSSSSLSLSLSALGSQGQFHCPNANLSHQVSNNMSARVDSKVGDRFVMLNLM